MAVETSLGAVSGGTIGQTQQTQQSPQSQKTTQYTSTPVAGGGTRVNVPGVGPVLFSAQANIPKVLAGIASSPNVNVTPQNVASIQNLIEQYQSHPESLSAGTKALAQQYQSQGFISSSEAKFLGPLPEPLAQGIAEKNPIEKHSALSTASLTSPGLPMTNPNAGLPITNVPFANQPIQPGTSFTTEPALEAAKQFSFGGGRTGGAGASDSAFLKSGFALPITGTAAAVAGPAETAFSSGISSTLSKVGAGLGIIAGTEQPSATPPSPAPPISVEPQVSAGLSSVGSKVGAGLGIATGTLQPAISAITPNVPKTSPALTINVPKEGETGGFIEQPIVGGGERTFLKVSTGTGETRFVQVPSTDEFVKASLTSQPFSQFKSSVLSTAGQSYDTQASQIISSGQTPSITKEQYLASIEKNVTPSLQKSLILQQYEPTVLSYVNENKTNLQTLSSQDIAQGRTMEIETANFTNLLKQGKIPLPLEATTLIYPEVLGPAVVGSIAKGIGKATGNVSLTTAGEETLTAAQTAQATRLAKAAHAGQTPLGTLGYEISAVNESIPGIAAESMALGIGAGAVTRGAVAGISSILPESVTEAAAGLSATAAAHPLALTTIGYAVPIGIESYRIGQRVGEGASLTAQATETSKEIPALAGFTYGFGQTLKYGTGLKYESQEIPLGREVTTTSLGGKEITLEPGQLEIAKTLSFEYKGEGPLGGNPLFLATKEEFPTSGGFHLGGPSFSESVPLSMIKAPFTPASATSAEVYQSLFSAPGAEPESQLIAARMGAVADLYPQIYGAKAPATPTKFQVESSHFDELAQGDNPSLTSQEADKLNKVLTDVTKSGKSMYVEVYGSQAQKLGLGGEEGGLARPAADVDILSKLKTAETAGAGEKTVENLRSDFATQFQQQATQVLGKGYTVTTTAEPDSSLVSVTIEKNGQTIVSGAKIADIHAIDDPEAAQAFAYGRSLAPNTYKIQGVPTSKLYIEEARKLASVGTVQPTSEVMTEIEGMTPSARSGLTPEEFFKAEYGTSPSSQAVLGPEAHRALKDISDVTRIAEGLAQGTPTRAAGIGAAQERYLEQFGMAAVSTSEGALPGRALLFSENIADLEKANILTGTSFGQASLTFGTGPSPVATLVAPTIATAPISPPPTVSAVPPSTGVSIPRIASPSAGLPSLTSMASVSASSSPFGSLGSLSSPSPPSPPSPPSSPSLPGSPSPSPSLASLSASISPSLSSSASVSPSLSASLSPSSSYAPPSAPYLGLPFTTSPERRKKGELAIKRKGRANILTGGREKTTYGILSEGLSKELFGKATISPGATEKGRTIFSPTAQLEKAGVSFGNFLAGGGYVKGSSAGFGIGKAGKSDKGIKGKGGLIKAKLKGLFGGELRMNYKGSKKNKASKLL